MKLLELFSGTHSIGKIAKNEYHMEVVSLDKDRGAECPFGSEYRSEKHFLEDIFTWNYKQYPVGHFDIITASPVCLWWSVLRYSHIGRGTTKDQIDKDIDRFGKPMVDKVFEILEYFQPRFWWIENPQTGRMKHYISASYSEYDYFYDIDYCRYSDWGFKKRTRIWTNIYGFTPKLCSAKIHSLRVGENNAVLDINFRQLHNYRIPFKLIRELLKYAVE